MIDKDFPYIKYELPNGVIVLLTPRPDRYDVSNFVSTWKPEVRFQFTDDIPDYVPTTPVHWYPWIPGKRLPLELVWAAVSLISKYVQSSKVIWMHCDSSSMRAPTFFGHYLHAHYDSDQIKKIVEPATWTDGRHHSSPIKYTDISFQMDPGMRELIETWKSNGEKAAYQNMMDVPFAGEKQ